MSILGIRPFPGSNEAHAAGCTCSALDNGFGNPALAMDRGGWVTVATCPLHADGPIPDPPYDSPRFDPTPHLS